MSFDKELKVVLISALGLLAYLLAASGVMAVILYSVGNSSLFAEASVLVAWLVVLLIPANFALCSLTCIIIYKRKERSFNEIKEHLNELSELTIECEKRREDKGTVKPEDRPVVRPKVSVEAI
ncbi:MAG: hypothetical protein FWG53_11030 [Clostridiales bacterium]|nr:hypothetical protein [Clostridiales bacterium]